MTVHGDVRLEDDGARWVMSGEIDAAVQAAVEDDLRAAAAVVEDRVVVDLTAVTFMDSSGLRLLYRAAAHSHRPPLLLGVPAHVHDLLELTGVGTLFETQPAADSSASG